MMFTLEEALGILEEFLRESSRSRFLGQAAEVVIESAQPRGLQLLAEVIYRHTLVDCLDSLLNLVQNSAAKLHPRREAVRAIAAILVTSLARLEDGESPDSEDEQPTLDRKAIANHAKQLMQVYSNPSNPDELRQVALEMAACVEDNKEIDKAALKAIKNNDPNWISSGLFALRNSTSDQALAVLRSFVDHPSKLVRFEAIQGLAELGEDEDYDDIEERLFEGSQEVSLVVLWALSKIKNERAYELLEEAAKFFKGELGVQAKAAFIHWSENYPPERNTSIHKYQPQSRAFAERQLIDGVWYRAEKFGDRIVAD